jgi:hypothetical protein
MEKEILVQDTEILEVTPLVTFGPTEVINVTISQESQEYLSDQDAKEIALTEDNILCEGKQSMTPPPNHYLVHSDGACTFLAKEKWPALMTDEGERNREPGFGKEAAVGDQKMNSEGVKELEGGTDAR